jgi:hypothetical protein
MKFAFISPIHDLECDSSDYHMALTHLVLKYPEYVDYYKRKRGYVILDNSLIELGGSVKLRTILDAAEKIGPDEIVLPDVYKDGKATLKSVKKSLIEYSGYQYTGGYELQAVCHGKDFKEWCYVWDELNKIDELHCIAIPKVTTNQFGRLKAVRYALENNPNNKEIHLLGCWDTVDEFKEYTDVEKNAIRGVDTSIVYHSSINGYGYNKGQLQKPDYKINLETRYNIDYKLYKQNQEYTLNLLN